MKHKTKLSKLLWVCLLSLLIACSSLPNQSQANKNDLYLNEIEVEILGAVNQPGKYKLNKKASIKDVVSMANGLREDADASNLNMNQIVSHHDVITIEVKTERQRVSINTATLEQLQTLPGIGPKTAQAIIDYRETNGLFQSVEELDHIKGIGAKKLDKLRDFIKL